LALSYTRRCGALTVPGRGFSYIGVVAEHTKPRPLNQPLKGHRTMNKNQITGRVDQLTGKVKEIAGKVVGNDKLEAEGKLEQAAGKVEAKYGDVKENAKDKAKSVIDKL